MRHPHLILPRIIIATIIRRHHRHRRRTTINRLGAEGRTLAPSLHMENFSGHLN